MGDPDTALITLLTMADVRLKSGGRLVFFMPTSVNVTEKEVFYHLQNNINKYRVDIEIVRVSPEPMNDSLWRWICVLQK